MSKPVMYLFANQGLGMSPGKLAAQVAHAAVEAWRIERSLDDDFRIKLKWVNSGYTKIVLAARDAEHLVNIERYLNDKGFKTALIIDEGRTEIASHTPTALGVEIVDKEDPRVQFAFGDFQTYKEPKPPIELRRSHRILPWTTKV